LFHNADGSKLKTVADPEGGHGGDPSKLENEGDLVVNGSVLIRGNILSQNSGTLT